MSMDASFRLAPKTKVQYIGGAGKSSSMLPATKALKSSEVTPNHAKKGEGERDTPKSILKTSTSTLAIGGAVAAPTTQSEATTIPGTWGMALSSHHPARFTSRTIRANPFEPLVHQRNFPKDGPISPLRFDEYHAYQQEHLQLPILLNSAGEGPPVFEIRIPTPHQQDDSSICSAVGDSAADEHYKNLYFSSQRELHSSRETVGKVTEENRLLKRHLIEMQKQLFSVSRNKRSYSHNGVQNTAWSIPASSENPSKRRKKEETSPVSSKHLTTISEASTIGDQHSPVSSKITKSVSTDAGASSTL